MASHTNKQADRHPNPVGGMAATLTEGEKDVPVAKVLETREACHGAWGERGQEHADVT